MMGPRAASVNARPPRRYVVIRLALSILSWVLLGPLLAGCAHIPSVPEPLTIDSGEEIQVQGSRGPLSRRATAALLQRLTAEVPDASALQRHLAVEQTVSGSPLYTGNRVSVLRDGPDTFAAMFAAIHGAQRYLYLEYYIFEDVSYEGEQLSDLLIERRAQGVHIDLIYDGIGSLSTPKELFDRLRAADIHVRQFNPIKPFTAPFAINQRDHRKILIADGQLAIIGGVNLSKDYEASNGSGSGSASHCAPEASYTAAAAAMAAAVPGPQPPERWHDVDLQIDGPAVRALTQLFGQHWVDQGGAAEELISDAPAPLARGDEVVRIIGSEGGKLKPRYYATLLSAIRSAGTHIWVTAAYFVPTHQEKEALARAARGGIDVRLLLPSHSDSSAALAAQQSHYTELLGAGVRIYERDKGILHSKSVVVDGVWSIVGSSNFDHRSLLFNDEVDAVVISVATGAQLDEYFQRDLQHASAIDLAAWKRRPLTRKLREHFWRLWEQLL
jgi:cardiolipin synthase